MHRARDPHSVTPRAALLLVALSLVVSSAADAKDLQPPPIGRTAVYACEGDFGHSREYTVRTVENGIVRSDFTVDGSPGFVAKPYWLNGTGLYQEIQTTKGARWRASGLEAFQGMRSSTIGSTFQAEVIEQPATGEPVRSMVTEKIVEGRQYQSEALGALDVITIEETWKTGSVTSFATGYLSLARAVSVYWRVHRSDGKYQECKLTALREP